MNEPDYSDRKNSRREKFSSKDKKRPKDYNDDYESYKHMKKAYKNRKQEYRDIETLEDLDEYQ